MQGIYKKIITIKNDGKNKITLYKGTDNKGVKDKARKDNVIVITNKAKILRKIPFCFIVLIRYNKQTITPNSQKNKRFNPYKILPDPKVPKTPVQKER